MIDNIPLRTLGDASEGYILVLIWNRFLFLYFLDLFSQSSRVLVVAFDSPLEVGPLESRVVSFLIFFVILIFQPIHDSCTDVIVLVTTYSFLRHLESIIAALFYF